MFVFVCVTALETRQPEVVETPQGTAGLNNRSPFTCDHFSYAGFTAPATTSCGI